MLLMVDTTTPPDVLDLRLAPREVVRIDGKTFDLMPIGDLSVRDQARVQHHVTRIGAIEEKALDATDEDETEYEDRLRALACIALPDAPARVIKRLALGQAKAIVLTFLARGGPEIAAIEAAAQSAANRRSQTFSRISRESTAEGNGS